MATASLVTVLGLLSALFQGNTTFCSIQGADGGTIGTETIRGLQMTEDAPVTLKPGTDLFNHSGVYIGSILFVTLICLALVAAALAAGLKKNWLLATHIIYASHIAVSLGMIFVMTTSAPVCRGLEYKYKGVPAIIGGMSLEVRNGPGVVTFFAASGISLVSGFISLGILWAHYEPHKRFKSK